MTLSNDLDIEIGIDGARLHHLHCADCGMRVERLYHPSVGYPTVPAAIVRSLAERQPTSPDTTI